MSEVSTGPAANRLLSLIDSKDCYDIPPAELRSVQIAAANERFQSRIGHIRLLGNRAESSNVREIRDFADLIPLLFAHTAYKSYPESWLTEGKWDRLGKWLDTISTNRVESVDTTGIRDIDEWLARLAAQGHFVSCSSGTGGKISMINATTADRAVNKRIYVRSMQWATGLAAKSDRHLFVMHPGGNSPRNADSISALVEAFIKRDGEHTLGVQITIGQTSQMVTLRRNIAEGSALPSDIAAFEKLSTDRQRAMDDALLQIAKELAEVRKERIITLGVFSMQFQLAEAVRKLGYSGKDFHPENVLVTAGGLKGVALPPDYREYILSTFNVQPRNVYHFYGMQELNTFCPRCSAGRYHVPPWLLLLLLDRNGENLLEPQEGEGRAGFFDLSIDGRWGGIITGDHLHVNYGKCACGHEGPTIGGEIVRYKDLPDGDHITCAGTIDAYVRGLA